MKHTKFKILPLFVLIISSYCIGQSNKVALSIYNKHGYKASIPILENSKKLNFENKARIANSYRLNHDTENAEIWYQDIIEETSNPLHYLYFAQALQSNEKYIMADQYFMRYEKLTSNTEYKGKETESIKAISGNRKIDKTQIKVENVASLNSEKLDFSPTYCGDQIVFISNRDDKRLKEGVSDLWTDDNFNAIWSATKDENGVLGTPEPFSEKITTKFHEGPLCFNTSKDKMFFTRSDYNGGKRRNNSHGVMKLQIYSSEKIDNKWSKPKSLNFNTKEFEEAHPALNNDGTRLYFSSDRLGGFGKMDLYYSDFKNGEWSEPINLGEKINTSGNDLFPFVHEDGTLYYSSNGRKGLGGLDIYSVSVDDNNIWNNVKNLGSPINSPKDDFSLILNEAKTEGYFSSARNGGLGKDDIYTFNISEIIEKDKTPQKEELIVKNKKIENEVIAKSEANKIHEKLDTRTTIDLPEVSDTKKSHSNKTIISNKDNFTNDTKIVSGTTSERIDDSNKYTIESNFLNSDITMHDIEAGAVLELPNIYYDFNSSYIRNDVKSDLDNVVSLMKKYPSLEIELSSHTDSRGSEAYNQTLSQKRANSAVQYIANQGVNPSRLLAKGYGESQLRNQCTNYIECSEEAHQYNRRTEIRVTKFEGTNTEVKYLENKPLIIHEADPNRKWNWN